VTQWLIEESVDLLISKKFRIHYTHKCKGIHSNQPFY
jgi:hypothetical protein